MPRAERKDSVDQSSPPSLAGGTPLFVEVLEDMADVRRDMLNSKKVEEERDKIEVSSAVTLKGRAKLAWMTWEEST